MTEFVNGEFLRNICKGPRLNKGFLEYKYYINERIVAFIVVGYKGYLINFKEYKVGPFYEERYEEYEEIEGSRELEIKFEKYLSAEIHKFT